MDGIVIVGLIIGLISYLLGSVATNVQLLSHRRDARKPPTERKNYIARPLWWAGFATSIVGSLLTTAALALAPATLISPLSALALLCTAIIGHYMNDESIRGILLPTFLIVVSAIITSVVSSKDSISVTPQQMIDLITRTHIIVYYVVIIAIFIILEVYCDLRLKRAKKEAYLLTILEPREDIVEERNNLPIVIRQSQPEIVVTQSRSAPPKMLLTNPDVPEVTWKEKMKFIDKEYSSSVKAPRESMTRSAVTVMELMLCLKAGLLGAQSVVFSKIVGSLIVGFSDAGIGLFEGIFSHWLPPVAIILLVAVTLGQVKLQQDALKF